jgi:hypothetical protein
MKNDQTTPHHNGAARKLGAIGVIGMSTLIKSALYTKYYTLNILNSKCIKPSLTKRILHKMSLSVHKYLPSKIIKSMAYDYSNPKDGNLNGKRRDWPDGISNTSDIVLMLDIDAIKLCPKTLLRDLANSRN